MKTVTSKNIIMHVLHHQQFYYMTLDGERKHQNIYIYLLDEEYIYVP